MRVFVAGATGVIGRGLVALLIDAGHEVTGMTRSPARADRLRVLGCEAAVCDALDASSVRERVSAARPDAVIHVLTANPPDLQPRNFKTALAPTNRLCQEGTRHLIAAARAADWIPVYASAIGARRPLHLPTWVGKLAGGAVAVEGMTAQRGASNAKAKSELDWQPRYASWRDGFRAAGG